MQLNIELPEHIENALREEWGDLSVAAKEALAIESYRTGRISTGFLAQMLGMGVIEAQEWLCSRRISAGRTPDDLDADMRDLGELFPELKQ